MYNKKLLSKAVKDLGSRKAPAKKKDMVVNTNKLLPFISSEGFKQGPPPDGTHYRIPGDTIYNPTPFDIRAVGSNGEEDIIAAGDTSKRTFQGSDYVDEYQAAYGGDISIPDLNQYEDGGEYDLTDEEIAELKAGGYIVEELPKAQTGMAEKTLPEITVTPAGYKGPVGAPTTTGFIPRKTPAQVQREELAKGKGPTREAAAKIKQAATKPKKLTAEEQALKEQKAAVDFLINRGYAAEMYGDKYYNQESQNPLSLEDYLLNDPNVEQRIKDAEYNIAKKNEAKRYQNAPWYDKALNEAQTFMVDPLGTPVRWAQGKRSLMGQAYRQLAPDDFADTEFYKKEAGIDPDNILYSATDIFNPFTTGASAGYSFAKGDVGSGALDLGLYFTGLKGLKKLKKHARPITSGLNVALKNFNTLTEERKGGSLPNIPKKKGSKGYSRSLLATNQLFAQNPLLKKPKSKKRKIFDPNAKYYAEGGFNDDINKHRDLLRDWTYGESIGMLQEKQIGGQKYSYAGRKDAIYTKDAKGNWLIKTPGTGMKWQPIDDPTGNRTNLLNKQARPLSEDAKVVKNKEQMAIINAKRKENILKNLRNEVKVFENEEKYLPHHKVDIGESTRVDTGINRQFTQSKHEAKRERIEDIKKALNQEAERQRIGKERSAYLKTPEAMFESQIKKKADWEKRASGRATPQDWVWTLPLAAAKAPQIIEAASTIGTIGSEALDAPLVIGNITPKVFGSPLTAGNVLRGFYAGKAALSIPDVIKQTANAKTTDEQVSALRTIVNTVVGTSPLVKWHNPLYSNLATPLSFAEHLRKFTSPNETVDPVAGSANLMRTISMFSKQDGGDVWEEEIDDKRRKELEALGYIIEDLD